MNVHGQYLDNQMILHDDDKPKKNSSGEKK